MGEVTEVSITDLRRNLSHYLSEVEKGRLFAITRYGKVVAYLVPPDWMIAG